MINIKRINKRELKLIAGKNQGIMRGVDNQGQDRGRGKNQNFNTRMNM